MKLLLIALIALYSIQEALSANCLIENYEYAPNYVAECCVLKGLKKDAAASGDSSVKCVAIVNASFKRLTTAFYERFPLLEHLIVRNSDLEFLHISRNVRKIDASGNKIKSVSVQSGDALQELNLRSNPINDIDSIGGLLSLTKLDLGNTSVAKEHTFDVDQLARLTNLTELHIDGLDLYYLDNTRNRPLRSLRLLDLSRNSFIPSNFQLDSFRAMPKLEMLLMRHCLLSTLSIYTEELRTNFPSLKQIYLEGNQLKCSLFSQLLELLKANGIEPVEPEQPEQCKQGFSLVSQMCCESFIAPVPPENTNPSSIETDHSPRPTVRPETPETPTDPAGDSSPQSDDQTFIIVAIAFAIIGVAGAIITVILRKKRKTQERHAIPRNEPNENFEM
uniref:Protein phosphatase 1 regulatory subunit n=1 Tax=Anopheles darlingi TaxID=43151 RepID=A0A2M4DQJ9_ANODA